MGKYRSNKQRHWAMLTWWRAKTNKCKTRVKFNQEPLPYPEIGDYIMAWSEHDEWWNGPTTTPLAGCKCTGSHTPHVGFYKIESLSKSHCTATSMHFTDRTIRIYIPSIIFNIGKIAPTRPEQDFSMLNNRQRRMMLEYHRGGA